MTVQISEMFRYRRKEYTVVAISQADLFDPNHLGLHAIGTCTNCYRGYQSQFSISRSYLVLRGLRINLYLWGDFDRVGPPVVGHAINNVRPRRGRLIDRFNNNYEAVNLRLRYTGGVLIGDDWYVDDTHGLSDHLGWNWRRLIELTFEDGKVMDEFDRSKQLAAIHKRYSKPRPKGKLPARLKRKEIAGLLDRVFDRRYDIGYRIW